MCKINLSNPCDQGCSFQLQQQQQQQHNSYFTYMYTASSKLSDNPGGHFLNGSHSSRIQHE